MYRSGAPSYNADNSNKQSMVSLKSASDDDRNSQKRSPGRLSQAAGSLKLPVSGSGSDTPHRAGENYSEIRHRFASASDCVGQPTETGTYRSTFKVNSFPFQNGHMFGRRTTRLGSIGGSR